MKGKSGKRNRASLTTGTLALLVIVLAVCAGILGVVLLRQESGKKNTENVKKEQQLENGKLSETENEPETKRELETENAPETKCVPETENAPETEDITETADGTGTERIPETNRGAKLGTAVPKKPGNFAEQETEIEIGTEIPQEEKLVVAIDPGHQGSWVNMSDTEPNGPGSSEMKAKASTGTQSPYTGKGEYELNLEISLLLRKELEERGYEVILTREDHDTAISNSERALMAYERGGDIYVRIHANGSDDHSVSGALAMVPSASNPYIGELAEDSYLLADCILNGYCERASFSSLGVQYYDNMTGINWSKLPVMILEMGFMTNEADDARMSDASVQPLMAAGIADGIDRYFTEKGMKKKEVSKEAQAKMDDVIKRVEQEFVGPAAAQGEKWAVSISDIETGAKGSIGGDRQLKSASIIKVFIMAAIYDRICYPSSEERHISFPESYEGELKQKITDMITVSDNNAANLLIESLGGGDAQAGMAVVNQFCEENGYTQTHLGRKFLEANPSGDNYTSTDDCCRLLESIYSGTCVNAEASAKMYAYLKNQTRRNKIPAGLSGTAAVAANKTGELAGDYGDYVENDIAVIENGNTAYVLCVMSNDVQDNGTAINRIAGIAGLVESLRTF